MKGHRNMKKIVVLNQKSYMDYDEVLDFISNIKDNIRRDLDVIICPSNIYIPYYKGKYDFKLGSQNLYINNITGECTSRCLKSLGVSYALIGHYERKYYLNEESPLYSTLIKDKDFFDLFINFKGYFGILKNLKAMQHAQRKANHCVIARFRKELRQSIILMCQNTHYLVIARKFEKFSRQSIISHKLNLNNGIPIFSVKV